MVDEQRMNFLGKEFSWEDIENIRSPALREITKKEFLSIQEDSNYCTQMKKSKCACVPFGGGV